MEARQEPPPLPLDSALARVDPRAPVIADNPREWPKTPEAVLALLGKPGAPFLAHSPKCIARLRWTVNPLTGERVRLFEGTICVEDCPVKMLEQLARDRWFLIRADERTRCTRCKQKHTYLTKGCVERPFNGLEEIMLAITTVVRTARHEDTAITAIHAGTIVPITAAKAAQLKSKIAAKGFRI